MRKKETQNYLSGASSIKEKPHQLEVSKSRLFTIEHIDFSVIRTKTQPLIPPFFDEVHISM